MISGNTITAEVIDSYRPITLEEMTGVKLMNRTDTKYVLTLAELNDLLTYARDFYRVQQTNEERLIEYKTTYYDTPELSMLRAHTTGRKTRQKIRVRTYVSSDLTFIEVKNKNNHGRTKKKRIETVRMADESLSDAASHFVDQTAWYKSQTITPALINSFRRITLVNNEMTERLTIDLYLSLVNARNGISKQLNNTVIVEVKRDGRQHSHIVDWLRNRNIRSHGFSKYCYGELLTDGRLPLGTMKPKMRELLRRGLIPVPHDTNHNWVA